MFLLVSSFLLFSFGLVSSQVPILENDNIRVNFAESDGDIFLGSITNLETDYTFDFEQKSAWEFVLINLNTLQEEIFTADNLNCDPADFALNNGVVGMRWNNCVIDVNNKFNVRMYVYLEGALSKWRLQVMPTLQNYSLGRIGNSIHISKDTNLDSFVALPTAAGLLVNSPETTLQDYPVWHPQQAAVQMSPYWVSNGNGLYITTLDEESTLIKQHDYDGHGTYFTVKRLYSVPNSLDPGIISTTVPYDFVIGVYEGDWYDASKLYRNWAEGTKILEKGRTETRTDIPQWWKEVDLS